MEKEIDVHIGSKLDACNSKLVSFQQKKHDKTPTSLISPEQYVTKDDRSMKL